MEPLRLSVEIMRCDGAGICAELLPELVDSDDWGYPILTQRSVPAHLLPLARRACELCPTLALRLEPADPKGKGQPGTPSPRH